MRYTKVLLVAIGIALIALAAIHYLPKAVTTAEVTFDGPVFIPVDETPISAVIGTGIYDVDGTAVYGTLYTYDTECAWAIVAPNGCMVASGGIGSPIPGLMQNE
jgi:hypothetical protein